MNRDAVICLVLFGVVLLLFAPARRYDLLEYDDLEYVKDPHVQRGLSEESVHWAFVTDKLAGWSPVTWLSYMADVQLFGAGNAAAHHFVNVLLHALNAMLLFIVLRVMSAATWESAIVAALWAVHPLRVESVAWVAERKDLLCAL